MKVIATIRKGGSEKYKALQITIPKDAVEALGMREGQRYLLNLADWELLE